MKLAWLSHFPVEWLPDAPDEVRNLPKLHPATWQTVLLDELLQAPKPTLHGQELELHIISVRRHFPCSFSFNWRGVTFHCLKLPRGMRTATLFWWETLLIKRCLRQIQPDLVHAWGTERGAALVASRLGYPYLVTMQGLLQWYAERVKLSRYQQLEAKLEPRSLRRASVVTTESRFAVQWLREHYPHLEVIQAEHASSWRFHRLERRPQLNPIQLLYVAPIAAIKGADILLQGLDRLRGEVDFRLTIIGPAPPDFLQRVKSTTSAALWERVTLRNNLTPAEVAEELSRATLVLFPTRVDTSPNSVKEAVVAGVPVVASAIGGIPDYVASGRNGITFPPGDLDAFVTAVRSALAHPLFRQGNVDPAVLAEKREYLSPRLMREKFLMAYERVLSKSG